MRRRALALGALLALAALFAGPALVSKALVDRPQDGRIYAATYAYIRRFVPEIRFATDRPVDRQIPGDGGVPVPARCVRFLAGGKGWLCVSLSANGKRFAAAWVVKRPQDDPGDLFLVDKDPETFPNR